MSSNLSDVESGRPRSLVDFAFATLRDEIVRGELPPGSPLRLRDHAGRLGISPIPMREALQRLEKAGLIVWTPHRGARVAEASIADMEDTYRVRLALESLAIREAAQLFDDADENAARREFETYAEASKAGDADRARAAHAAFHLALYRPAASPWVDRLVPQLWDSAERYRRMALQGLGTLDERIQEHRRLLDTCRANDANAAVHALELHFERTQRVIRDRLGPSTEAGRRLIPVSLGTSNQPSSTGGSGAYPVVAPAASRRGKRPGSG
jgi:DNA-binding GntR family transcriptional regulator